MFSNDIFYIDPDFSVVKKFVNMNIIRRLLNTSVARQCIRKCHEEILPPNIELKGAISAKFQVINNNY